MPKLDDNTNVDPKIPRFLWNWKIPLIIHHFIEKFWIYFYGIIFTDYQLFLTKTAERLRKYHCQQHHSTVDSRTNGKHSEHTKWASTKSNVGNTERKKTQTFNIFFAVSKICSFHWVDSIRTIVGIANEIRIFFRPNLFVMNPNKKLPNKAPGKQNRFQLSSHERNPNSNGRFFFPLYQVERMKRPMKPAPLLSCR